MAFVTVSGFFLLLRLMSIVHAVQPIGSPQIGRWQAPVVPKRTVTFEGPVVDRNGTEIPPYNTTYYFDQLIDHTNPSLGTFSQRYWTTWEFYESGGPIVLNTPGETDADGLEIFLTNETIVGLIAQQQNGATVLIEHRFYGYSNPYNNLSVASLQVHTIQQAIDDLVYFANNVQLPMPGGDNVSPANAPWILVGGSYAGALTSFTMMNQPGTFWASYSSSGVVESIIDFWQYYDIVRQYMPQNCSADVQAVIAYIDQTFTNGTDEEIQAVKTAFSMNLTHLDDFGSALIDPFSTWQDLQPDSGPGTQFYQFCDALEVQNGTSAPAQGWGLDTAYQAWSSWWSDVYMPNVCGDQDADDCLGTYDPTNAVWTNITINNAGRSWGWIVCNYMGFFQSGAPDGTSTIISRLVQPAYYERWCTYYFPEQFPNITAPDASLINTDYKGYSLSANRLFQATGERDPWLDTTVSAQGLNLTTSAGQPIAMSDGFHCSDLYTANGVVDPTVASVQNKALSDIQSWLEEWQPSTST